MYDAMVRAELDDDVLGHDPTTLSLERFAAETVGKEDAIFVPSGTMGNQIALAVHTQPGDSVLIDDDAHMLFYECGTPAVVSGVQARTVPSSLGVIDTDKITERYLHKSLHTPGTTLLCLENTHNRAGGTVTPLDVHRECRQIANQLDMKIHLDGARVFNAAAAIGAPVKSIADEVDSICFCLSKGLASPIGSLLCGSADFIERARFWRKRFGGGMRQSGILAACGIVSLQTMTARLAEDHERARRLSLGLARFPTFQVVPPQTNIVMIDTESMAEHWISALSGHGVWLSSMGPKRLRAVFHKDVGDDGLEQALLAFQKVSDSGLG